MKKIVIPFFLINFWASLVFAQVGKLAGKVMDTEGHTLIGANVYIKELSIGSTTDNNGNFTILNLEKGKYSLRVSYLGYQAKEEKVEIIANRTTFVEIKLKPGIVEAGEVVVLGERIEGQARALNQQRTNDNITNIISTDQIGRFPDQNIGDALKRVASITVNYDQGEARYVNIRGTEPRLNSIMINGERVPSAEAEIRNVQVDLIPSDMVQTIQINKAITPDMDADAIGGAVNLVTRAPSSLLRLSSTLASGYNFLSEKPIWNGALVFANRYINNKLGVVLSGSLFDHNLGSDNTEGTWENDDGNIFPSEWEVRAYKIRRLRQSLAASFDYQLSPTDNIYLKTMYNQRNDWENRYRLRYRLDKDRIVKQTKGGINNNRNNNARLEDQRTFTISLKGEHVLLTSLKINWATYYSSASEERPNERYISFQVKNIEQFYDISNPEKPIINYNSSLPEDLNNWEFDELTEERQFTEEKNYSAKIDLELPISQGINKNTLKFGAKYSKKDKLRDNNFFSYTPINSFETLANVPVKDYTDNNFLAGPYKIGKFATEEFLGSLDLNDQTLFEKEDVPAEYAPQNFNAKEKIFAAYAMLEQNVDKNLKIIAGFRVENTSLDYAGNEFNEETEEINKTYGSDSYTNFLPGVHIKFNLSPNLILRAAWTNTIARPNYYDLVPYRNIITEDNELEVGNPALKPTRSMNFDLMLENYFEDVGIISGGVFYKSIKDFIYIYNQDDYFDPVSGNVYEIFQPRNGASATLFGFEFSLQKRLDFLPGLLNNLNFYSNYTYIYSKADNPMLSEQVDGDKDIALPGTAPHTLNLALTYQDEKMALGVAFNYTAPYLDPDELDLTPGLERYYDEVTYLDFNGYYRIMPQLRLFFEVNNLLNQPLRYYAGESSRTYQAEYYNIHFTAGIKFDL
ncbi:TonB-dependent receptor [Melioribacter sp. OK-6-Me]|uniref:TonB-dependent receptor n=1 Tax=unclassified Melioribacter TaxID=2627329 RepID=UPI003ED8FC21